MAKGNVYVIESNNLWGLICHDNQKFSRVSIISNYMFYIVFRQIYCNNCHVCACIYKMRHSSFSGVTLKLLLCYHYGIAVSFFFSKREVRAKEVQVLLFCSHFSTFSSKQCEIPLTKGLLLGN